MNLCDQNWIVQAARHVENMVGRQVDSKRSLTIDAFFDFICPWCLIGKRNLEKAIAVFGGLRPDAQVKVRWRSHQLLPYTPLNGLPYQDFCRERLGGPEAVIARRAEVQRAGSEAGIDFAFDRISVLPNTAAAHELIAFAANRLGEAQRATLVDRVLVAYFLEGEDIGDREVLERLGQDCGLDGESLKTYLTQWVRRVDGIGRRVSRHQSRVRGVPHFVFSTGYTFSGVHSPEVIAALMVSATRN